MKTRLALALSVASLAALPASGAQAASFTPCGKYDGERYGVKNISCKAAKRVLVEAGFGLCFDNQVPGWRKVRTPLPTGGSVLTLKKGDKAIRTRACSPD